ncbi:TRAP transporter substrate-binding protein DctP [Plastorhodobacter daqingensis]|uniref:TRAP transporter substrate-binding protein DctP n=1 Tax=Plastorhodobacter daqingensis TaxID=1387281 RepID=A0ABW2UKD4_9RHOB
MKLLQTTAAAALAVVLGLAAGAEARELRTAPGGPPPHPANGVLYTNFAQYLPEESDGRLTAQILGTEVVTLGQMKDALQSQLVEVGNLLPLYFPADLPNMALAGEMALSGRSPHAMAAAMTEYMVNCATCQEEMSRFGIVYLGSGSSDVYTVLTNRPVRTAADLRGLRLRSGGAPFSRWAEHFGAVPTDVSVNDQFESMSQGVIDGSMASVADLLSFRLIELATHYSELPLGTYHATSNFAFSLPVWQSLDAEDRAAIIRAANRANADFTQRWGYTMREEAQAAAAEAGIERVEPDAELLAASEAFAEADRANAITRAQQQFGLADAEERVEIFLGLVDKWTAIVEELDGDPAAIAERVQAEVWDNVDPAAYGG